MASLGEAGEEGGEGAPHQMLPPSVGGGGGGGGAVGDLSGGGGGGGGGDSTELVVMSDPNAPREYLTEPPTRKGHQPSPVWSHLKRFTPANDKGHNIECFVMAGPHLHSTLMHLVSFVSSTFSRMDIPLKLTHRSCPTSCLKDARG